MIPIYSEIANNNKHKKGLFMYNWVKRLQRISSFSEGWINKKEPIYGNKIGTTSTTFRLPSIYVTIQDLRLTNKVYIHFYI